MTSYIINGKFMADRMQGIVRYARELVNALDPLLDKNIDVTLVMPPNAVDIPEFQNIRTQMIGKRTGILWEQTDLRRYVNRYKGSVCVNFCNVAPFFVRSGITVIHDIMYKVNPSYYTTLRNKLSRLWHVLQYKYLTSHERTIITVSQYSKNEIEQCYPCAKGKIQVIYSAWQHVLARTPSTDWRERYPDLVPDGYYFSLSTLSRNKNGKWIIEAAKNNPDCIFAMAGKHYETEYDDIPANVHMLGFISDEDACALIKNCKAFLYPSLYEGFGLPPLEALALGAEVISSNATSLPEVLGNSVHYIDPLDWNVDLDALLQEWIEPKDNALNKFGWTESAEKLYQLLNPYNT